MKGNRFENQSKSRGNNIIGLKFESS